MDHFLVSSSHWCLFSNCCYPKSLCCCCCFVGVAFLFHWTHLSPGCWTFVCPLLPSGLDQGHHARPRGLAGVSRLQHQSSVCVCVLSAVSKHAAGSPSPNLFTQVQRGVCVFITTVRICRRSQALILREGCKRLSELLSVATADYCGRDTQGKGGLDKPEVFERYR